MEITKVYINQDIREVFEIFQENGIDLFKKNGKSYSGILEIYGEEDKLELKGELRDGVRSMEWKHYYSNGQESIIEHYLMGRRNGRYEMYYEDGTLKLKGYLLNDKEDGCWEWYYETGIIEGEADYVNGEIKGIWRLYYNTGILNRQTETLENGITEKLIRYNEEGKRIYEGYMENNVNIGRYTRYYDTGEIKETGHYKKGKLEGEIKKYDKSNKVEMIETYKNGNCTQIYDRNSGITKYFNSEEEINDLGNGDKLTMDLSEPEMKKVEDESHLLNFEKEFETIISNLIKSKNTIKIKRAEMENILREIPENSKQILLERIEKYLEENEIGRIEFDTGAIWTEKDVYDFFKENLK